MSDGYLSIDRQMHQAPRISKVLETAAYVDDLDRAAGFYERLLGLSVMSRSDRLVALDAGGATVFLLFKKGATTEGVLMPNGWIPPHDGSSQSHFAFAIGAEELDQWRKHLRNEGVDIESEVVWERGGTSIYFRDPDGHSVELATPGIWPVY